MAEELKRAALLKHRKRAAVTKTVTGHVWGCSHKVIPSFSASHPTVAESQRAGFNLSKTVF